MKQTSLKLIAAFIGFFISFGQAAYAVPWSETTSTIYTTDVNKSVGIGTTTPTYEFHAVSNVSTTDPYYFISNSTTTGERDIFTIRDSDAASSTQDESSVLKVMKSQTINSSADAFTLLELSHTATLPGVADRQFYVLGRGGNDEGSVAWGISLTDADFWTQGSIRGGAVGTNCGGTGTTCFSNPSFQLSASGNSYITGGNVGIGTTAPTTKLEVVDGGILVNEGSSGNPYAKLIGDNANEGLNIWYENNTGHSYIDNIYPSGSLYLRTNNGGTNGITLLNTGSVGIGTTMPGHRLEVSAPGGSTMALNTIDNYGPNLTFGGSTSFKLLATNSADTAGAHKFILSNVGSNADLVTVDYTGNVGIGTTLPTTKLEVVDGGILVNEGSSGNPYAKLIGDSANEGLNIWYENNTGHSYIDNIYPSGSLYLRTNNGGTNGITLLNTGSVGIGTTNPIEKLDVSGNIRASGTICDSVGCIGSSSSSSGLTGSGTNSYLAKWMSNTNLGNSQIYDNGTNVGINTTSPDKKLTVGGNLRIDNKLYGPTSDALSLYSESGKSMKFYTNGNSERMRISADGYVGINADPDSDYSLRVDNNSNVDDTAAIAGHSWADTGNTIGVYGITASNGIGSGSPAGVFGWAIRTGQGGDTFGVLGRTSTQGGYDPNTALDDTAVAVYGEAIATSGMSMGVWGETFSSENGASGVRGVANTSSGVVYGVHGSAPTSGYAVYASGTLSTSGPKPAVVYTEMQGPTEIYSIESPDIWFEDIQFAQLKDGRAHIELDPLFRQTVTIDENNPFHVFLQSYDASANEHLTVHKNKDSFDVINVDNPKSNIFFSYRIMAKRHFYEDRRLKAVDVPVDIHMRPDLSQDQIDALNQRLNLNYIPQKSQPLDIGDISDHQSFNEQSDFASE